MHWGIDISSYQSLSDYTWADMKAHGLDFVIIRACQGYDFVDSKLDRHVNACIKYQIPFGFYQWVDPTESSTAQGNYYLALINKYNPSFVAGDFEQYWASWTEWYDKYINKKNITLTELSPDTINSRYYNYYTYMINNCKLPFVSYSAAWFVDQHAPTMSKWLNNSFYWTASYNNNAPATITWDSFFTKLNAMTNPRLPIGITKWDIWQWSSIQRIPGTGDLDLNMIRDDIVYQTLTNVTLPTYYMAVVTALYGLNVRTGPGTNYSKITALPYGASIRIYETQPGMGSVLGWGRIGIGQWVSLDYVRRV